MCAYKNVNITNNNLYPLLFIGIQAPCNQCYDENRGKDLQEKKRQRSELYFFRLIFRQFVAGASTIEIFVGSPSFAEFNLLKGLSPLASRGRNYARI